MARNGKKARTSTACPTPKEPLVKLLTSHPGLQKHLTYLVHPVGHSTDNCLIPEMLVETLNVDLPVDAIIGWWLRKVRELFWLVWCTTRSVKFPITLYHSPNKPLDTTKLCK